LLAGEAFLFQRGRRQWIFADEGWYLVLDMLRFQFILLLSALVLTPPVAGQDVHLPDLSHVVPRHDWGIIDIGEVRFGRVAVVETPDGPHLQLRRLLKKAPGRPPPRMEGRIPRFDGNNLVVSDFGQGNRTPLGGYFSTFQRVPSAGGASVGQGPDRRRALKLTCHQQFPGFCGLWIQLYDAETSPDARFYLDARGFSVLSFWIRGRAGGERVLLKVADADWERREDALPVGEVSAFLSSGRVETEWQRAVVRLDSLPARLRHDLLALIVFEALAPGTTSVEFGPMAFSLSPEPLPAMPGPAPQRESSDLDHKATWVWNTAELLRAPGRLTSLLDFLEGEGFDRVFLQLPGNPDQPTAPGELAIDGEALRPMVAAFRARGISVYALDGFARYALPDFHAGVLNTIDHVARYNRAVLPHERFHGVRYDIEPYLLPMFHGPDQKPLLESLLRLTAASVERAHSAGLVYGADIPFWYDAPSEDTYERITVSFAGTEKPLSEHIIDLVDDVAIMDYRTRAHGADGTIRHATGELEYANAQGKSVFIGLETFAVPDEVLVDFRGEPEEGLPMSPPPGPIVALGSGQDSIYAALFTDAVSSSESLAALAEWLGRNRLDPETVRWWPASKQVEVPAAKVTFANRDPLLLDRVMRATAEELDRYDSFAGFAIHHAQSYRALVGR
jgi:hypothetical protein